MICISGISGGARDVNDNSCWRMWMKISQAGLTSEIIIPVMVVIVLHLLVCACR